MAFLLKEIVFLALVATVLTFPWKPMVNDIIYDTPREQEDFPRPFSSNDGTDTTKVDELPPKTEVDPPHEKRGTDTTEVDELPPKNQVDPPHEKRGTDTTEVNESPPKTEIDPPHKKRGMVPHINEPKLDMDNNKRALFYGNSRDSHFEGNKKSRMKRGATTNTWRWPKGNDGVVTIPFIIASSLSSEAETWLQTVVRQLRQDTCIDLVEYDSAPSGGTKYVEFTGGNGCSSPIGCQANPKQTVTLGAGCQYRGTIAHEIMHTLGFYHEHTRTDRDQYITVKQNNIMDGFAGDFAPVSQQNFGYYYDKNSIMQYSGNTFGKDGAVTMESKSNPNEKLGAVSHMDANDLGKINAYYGCSNPKTFVDHTITLTTGTDWGAGTDGYVYLKLVGSIGTTDWELITSGGEYDDENENGDVQTYHIPFPNVGSISSVKVALVAEGGFPNEKKKRSTEADQEMKRFWSTIGWSCADVTLDGVSFGGDDLDEDEVATLNQ